MWWHDLSAHPASGPGEALELPYLSGESSLCAIALEGREAVRLWWARKASCPRPTRDFPAQTGTSARTEPTGVQKPGAGAGRGPHQGSPEPSIAVGVVAGPRRGAREAPATVLTCTRWTHRPGGVPAAVGTLGEPCTELPRLRSRITVGNQVFDSHT